MTYSLLIPTYNRPGNLERLLRYLQAVGADFPILVLDSSAADAMAQNRQTVAQASLDIQHHAFPNDMHPFEKFLEGARLVKTPLCSMCADDDFILLPGLRDCIAALNARPEATAAHGNYFNFIENVNGFNLSYVVQRGNQIDSPTPTARLRHMLSHYDAPFYATYRTADFARILESIRNFRTTLAAEICLAGATAAAGSVLRLDRFYLGRNTAVSLSPDAWHPHEILCKFPERLFEDLPELQQRLITALRAAGATENDTLLRQTIELLWLRYLGPFLRNDAVDFILDQKLGGQDGKQTLVKFWDTFVASTRSIHPMVPLTGRGGDAYAPDAMRDGYSPRDYFVDTITPGGERRRYNIFFEFLFPDLKPPCQTGLPALNELLAAAHLY